MLVLLALVALSIFASSESQEMDCDHPAAEQGHASAKVGPRGVTIRGERIDKAANVRLADLLRSPQSQNGKAIVVEGKVRRACTRMGCWMELAETDRGPGVRVTFKDYGFFVPLDSAGAMAKVAGTVKFVELSEAAAAHYKSEGGRVAKGTQREVQLVATGVELRR
jgi:hypothetical protein